MITGGEPLLQKEPLSVLVDRLRSFYTVQIETSGHMIDAEHTVRPSCWVVDYKLKGSAMNHRMMPWVNYSKFNAPTYIKFVVANEEDVMEAIAAAYNMKQDPNNIVLLILHFLLCMENTVLWHYMHIYKNILNYILL